MENKKKDTEYLNTLFDTGAEVGEAAAMMANKLDPTASVLAFVDTLMAMKNNESPDDATIMICGAIFHFAVKYAKEIE